MITFLYFLIIIIIYFLIIFNSPQTHFKVCFLEKILKLILYLEMVSTDWINLI